MTTMAILSPRALGAATLCVGALRNARTLSACTTS